MEALECGCLQVKAMSRERNWNSRGQVDGERIAEGFEEGMS